MTEAPHMVHRDQYSEIWRQAGVSESVIAKAADRYESLPTSVVYAVATDVSEAGVAPFEIPYSDEHVDDHDNVFLLKKLGYPVSSDISANAALLFGETEDVVKNTALTPLKIAIGVIGSLGGLVWYLLK